MKKISPITYHLLLIVCLSYFAIRPLFHLGFFPMHDDTQVVRVNQMALALKDGQLPVRWVADLGYGYGYPIFNFYAPLPYYLGGFFNLVGFDALAATKMMFGLGIILAGVSMYFLAKEFWDCQGGVLAALFYVYAPYHAVQVYVRGSVGELWAYAFLPLVFFGVYRLWQNKPGAILLSSLSLAAVILSHNLTVLMLSPFLSITLLILFFHLQKRRLFIIQASFFILLAVGLSAFYWLPALSEMHFTKVFSQLGGGADWKDHFVYFDQLWSSPWGFGGSASGRLDGMSFAIGKPYWLAVIASLGMMVFYWKGKKKRRVIALIMSWLVFSMAVFLLLPAATPVWRLVRLMAFIQYPWRFLVLAALAASFAAGSLACFARQKMVQNVFTIGAAGLLIAFSQKYFQPQKDISPDYLGEANAKWFTSRISDEYLPQGFPVPSSQNEVAWQKTAVLSGQAKISQAIFKSHRYQFTVTSQTKSEILVNLAFFPGWQVWVDGQKLLPPIIAGRPHLSLTTGIHEVELRLLNTPVRTVANFISLIAVLAGCAIFAKKK